MVLGRETTPDPDTSAIMSSSSSCSSTAGDTGTSLPEEVIQRFRGQSREVSACNQILFIPHPHLLLHLAKILKTQIVSICYLLFCVFIIIIVPSVIYIMFLVQDLIEMVCFLQRTVESQGKKVADLEDYIDSMVLRVMERAPVILESNMPEYYCALYKHY